MQNTCRGQRKEQKVPDFVFFTTDLLLSDAAATAVAAPLVRGGDD